MRKKFLVAILIWVGLMGVGVGFHVPVSLPVFAQNPNFAGREYTYLNPFGLNYIGKWNSVVQHVISGSNCTSSPCALTVTSTTAGNPLLFCSAAQYSGTGTSLQEALTFVSDNGTAETWTHAPNQVVTWFTASAFPRAADCYYVASAAGGATSVSAYWTFSGLTSTTITITDWFLELSTSPAGQPVYYDTGNTLANATNCSTCTGPAGLIGGELDAVAQIAIQNSTPTGIASPYATADIKAGVAAAFSSALNQTTYSAPSWTQTSNTNPNGFAMAAFSLVKPSVTTYDGYNNFNTCTATSAPTAACLASSAADGSSPSGDITSLGAGITVSTAGPPVALPATINANGATYTGTESGAKSIQCITGTSVHCGFVQFSWSTAAQAVSYGFTFLSTCPANGSQDCGATSGLWSSTGTTDYDILHVAPLGVSKLCLENINNSGCTSTGNSAITYYGGGTPTFSNGSAVITMANNYAAGVEVEFFTSGSLPTNFTTWTPYYVISTGLSSSQFEVSATVGGTAIQAGSAGSGTHQVGVPYRVNMLETAGANPTITFSNGSAVISATNAFYPGQPLTLSTTGGLPTNFATATPYYVSQTGLSASQFELASSVGGTPIVAGSAGSGTQKAVTTDIQVVCYDHSTGTSLGLNYAVGAPTASIISTITEGFTGEEPSVAGYYYYFSGFVWSRSGAFSTTSCQL